MKEVYLNQQCYHLPESWTEVPIKDLPALLTLLYVHPENGSTYLEVLRTVLGYTPRQWARLMRHYFGPRRSADQVDGNAQALQDVLGLLTWMWKGELTVNPFPEGFVVDGYRWLLFEEGFKSMSFGEMTNAHIHAQAFIKQLVEGDERLDLLVATVCRPEQEGNYAGNPGWNGDRREPYNDHIARHRATSLKEGYTKEKVLVLMFFLGTQKEFFSYYDLFESDGSAPPVQEEYPGQSLIKNQHLLAEKHIFGGMTDTKTANIHDVFQFLEEHRKDIKAHNQRVKESNDTH